MKLFRLAVPALTLLLASPVAAQDAHADQQMCLTWLSLAAQWAPDAQREGFGKQYLALDAAVDARTDLDADTKSAEAKVAIDAFNKWMIDHGMGTPENAKTMEADLVPKATNCAVLVPNGENDDVLTVPGPGGVDGGGSAG